VPLPLVKGVAIFLTTAPVSCLAITETLSSHERRDDSIESMPSCRKVRSFSAFIVKGTMAILLCFADAGAGEPVIIIMARLMKASLMSLLNKVFKNSSFIFFVITKA